MRNRSIRDRTSGPKLSLWNPILLQDWQDSHSMVSKPLKDWKESSGRPCCGAIRYYSRRRLNTDKDEKHLGRNPPDVVAIRGGTWQDDTWMISKYQPTPEKEQPTHIQFTPLVGNLDKSLLRYRREMPSKMTPCQPAKDETLSTSRQSLKIGGSIPRSIIMTMNEP